jgi:F-type H+-transporting ATPase subunit delta
VRESIRGYADAVVEDAEGASSLAALAGDLDGMASVIAGSDDLRLILSDTGIPAHARRGVVADLFGSQVGADTLRLVLFALDVDRASEVVDDIGWLATRSAAARDGLHATGSGTLGHHAALECVDGYASAVLEAVRDAGGLADVEDELFRFERIIAGSDALTEALTSRDLEVAARAALVTDLLGSKTGPATTRLAAYLATVGRPRDYPDLLRALVARVAAETQRRIAEVRAVTALTDAQQQRLAAALGRLMGQAIEVRVVVDPSVLGGFVATIGDTVVDGSVRHRLESLKERLVLSDASSTT